MAEDWIPALTVFYAVKDVIGAEFIQFDVGESVDGARWGSELGDQTRGQEEL
jgi:hypothetical protein